MATHPSEDIASKLLHSSDARIAEAAKRVFSATYPVIGSTRYSGPPSHLPSTLNHNETTSHESVGHTTDEPRGIPFAVGVPLHGVVESVALTSPGPLELAALNDEFPEDREGCDKKPSTTERLQRR